eukprot:scaffold269909_cov67-Attheya_sp.AAC.2
MMKLAILSTILASAAAFAPATGVARHTALNAEKSQALPFLPAPPNTEGYLGNVGFDPLRFSDYIPMDYLREAELKHGRICMMAWAGFVAVDNGMRIYPLPEAYQGLTSVSAHEALVKSGAMGNMLVWFAIMEMVAWIGVSQMLQGSGRAAGDYGLGHQFMGKTDAEREAMKLKELKNGRLAMLAFSGVVTQAVLYDKGFPYM